MPASSAVSLLKELDLMVSTGAGIAQVAPSVYTLVSKIMGAEAVGMCWFDEAGAPQGFYQQGSSRDAELLFMNHYEELFMGPYEYTPFWSVRNKGRSVGNALQTSKEYFRSNTYNLLIKPSHCHFLLDALVDLEGVIRLTACFFRSLQNPFTQADVQKLAALVPVLRRAITKSATVPTYRCDAGEEAHMLISSDGQRIEMQDANAQKLLATIRLFDQGVSLTDSISKPPRFVQALCNRLRNETLADAAVDIDLAGRTFYVRANGLTWTPSFFPAGAESPHGDPKILITLQVRRSGAIEVVRTISQWDLSPLQARVAMYAASGGSRMECALHHKVSKEALKKHLRQIYAASRCTDWQELTVTLQSSPSLML